MVSPAELGALDGEALAVAPVHVQGQVTNTGDSMLVQGQARGQFAMTCARCLQPMRAEVAAEFQERFRRQGGRRHPEPAQDRWEAPVSPGEEEDDARPYQGDWLDLDAPVREALLLHLPMKPVCEPGCRGLCPHCGANLNETTCDCRPESIDPRLAVLKEWEKRPGAD